MVIMNTITLNLEIINKHVQILLVILIHKERSLYINNLGELDNYINCIVNINY